MVVAYKQIGSDKWWLMGLMVFWFINILSAEPVSSYYQIEKINIPEDIVLEVGGLAFNEKGELGVCTRRGEVWLIKNPTAAKPTYQRFAHGLHEPLGLNYKDGSFYLAQRGELTKLTDTDGDDKADEYETIYTWDLAGNYHEYSYGPVFKNNGDMLVTLNLGWVGHGASLSKWRGWMIQISPDGKMTPLATGMRSPAGFGLNKNGDIFYTENQGDWVGSGRMTHIESGDFVGHPEGLLWSDEPASPLALKFEDIDDTKEISLYDYKKVFPAVKPPSVWFPHGLMGISTSDIQVFPSDFGPYEGQLLVGDQGHSKLMRVAQEKVNGVYQGACFPFVEGFSSGVLRMRFHSDNALYVGMTSRGWRSTGPETFALERLKWTGKTPFEIKHIKIQEDGFLLEFTEEVDRSTASNIASYGIQDFTYKYHHFYGSPVTDKAISTITKVEVAEDGRSARLYLDNIRLGYIYEIKAGGVNHIKGKKLLHQVAYYTVNQLPKGAAMADHSTHGDQKTTDLASAKRITELPEGWEGDEVKTITIGTKPGLKFDKELITVNSGDKIKLIFNNPDDMLHNLLIINPNTGDAIAQAALDLGLDGQAKGYIPDSEDVLYHTNLLPPESQDVIYFEAPSRGGDYIFICTFPGHGQIMRGILRVVGNEF